MAGAYGNDNLLFVRGSQFLTVDGSSDTLEIPAGTYAVDLYSSAACWVYIGEPGATPTAAAPGAEKTEISGFYVPAATYVRYPVPIGTENSRPKIAAIQDSGGGTLYVTWLTT